VNHIFALCLAAALATAAAVTGCGDDRVEVGADTITSSADDAVPDSDGEDTAAPGGDSATHEDAPAGDDTASEDTADDTSVADVNGDILDPAPAHLIPLGSPASEVRSSRFVLRAGLTSHPTRASSARFHVVPHD